MSAIESLPLATLVMLGGDVGLSRVVVVENWSQVAISKLPERVTWRPDFA